MILTHSCLSYLAKRIGGHRKAQGLKSGPCSSSVFPNWVPAVLLKVRFNNLCSPATVAILLEGIKISYDHWALINELVFFIPLGAKQVTQVSSRAQRCCCGILGSSGN